MLYFPHLVNYRNPAGAKTGSWGRLRQRPRNDSGVSRFGSAGPAVGNSHIRVQGANHLRGRTPCATKRTSIDAERGAASSPPPHCASFLIGGGGVRVTSYY